MPSFPPSDRDLEIYESVHIAGYSLRAAAAKHSLSVARIRQIAKRVIAFLAQTLPEETDLDKQKQIQIARHIAADRLQFAQCELMDLWRQTQDPSYLLKTTRLTLAAARLGVVAGTIEGAIADAWDAAGLLDEDGNPLPETENQKSKTENPPSPKSEICNWKSEISFPPVEDCAPAPQPNPTRPALTSPPLSPTTVAFITSARSSKPNLVSQPSHADPARYEFKPPQQDSPSTSENDRMERIANLAARPS